MDSSGEEGTVGSVVPSESAAVCLVGLPGIYQISWTKTGETVYTFLEQTNQGVNEKKTTN